jgi:hypothetical protein
MQDITVQIVSIVQQQCENGGIARLKPPGTRLGWVEN